MAPLERNPAMPRVEVDKLRSTFAVGRVVAKTLSQQQIYVNAMTVCDWLTRAMDDRAKAKSNAEASATVPSMSSGGGITKSMPMRGVGGKAIRKKQKDERKYADQQGKNQSAFVESVAYRAWTERAVYLRQNVMAIYTRQAQLEALDARNTPPPTPSASQASMFPPPAERPSPAVEKAGDPGRPIAAAFAGVWKSDDGRVGTFVLQRDQTGLCIRSQDLKSATGETKGKWILDKVGEKVGDKVGGFLSWVGGEAPGGRKGKWSVDKDGTFTFRFDEGGRWIGKFSDDRQTLLNENTKVRFRRQN